MKYSRMGTKSGTTGPRNGSGNPQWAGHTLYRNYWYRCEVGYIGLWTYYVFDRQRALIYSYTANPAIDANTQLECEQMARAYIDQLYSQRPDDGDNGGGDNGGGGDGGDTSPDPPPQNITERVGTFKGYQYVILEVVKDATYEIDINGDNCEGVRMEPLIETTVTGNWETATTDARFLINEWIQGCKEGGNEDDNGGSNGDNGGSNGDNGEVSSEERDFALIGLFAILGVAYILFEAFKGESPSGA